MMVRGLTPVTTMARLLGFSCFSCFICFAFESLPPPPYAARGRVWSFGSFRDDVVFISEPTGQSRSKCFDEFLNFVHFVLFVLFVCCGFLVLCILCVLFILCILCVLFILFVLLALWVLFICHVGYRLHRALHRCLRTPLTFFNPVCNSRERSVHGKICINWICASDGGYPFTLQTTNFVNLASQICVDVEVFKVCKPLLDFCICFLFFQFSMVSLDDFEE